MIAYIFPAEIDTHGLTLMALKIKNFDLSYFPLPCLKHLLLVTGGVRGG